MKVEELISSARDMTSAKRVYGDPYEKNGITVIPAATVRGGGGGGGDRSEGEGGGFGLAARPTGAWVVEDDEATWRPAIDVNRIVLGGQVVAMTAILVIGRLLLARSRRGRWALRVVSGAPRQSLPRRYGLRLTRG